MIQIRLIFGAFLLIFLPAVSQVQKPNVQPKQDTARLFRELDHTISVRKEIVDSMVALRKRIDSTGASRSNGKTFRRYYHVDHLDGKRDTWIFIYDISGGDTLFNHVKKIHTRWK